MSFIKITKANTDTSYVRLHPSRSFSSSSLGVIGSVRVIAQSSPFFKEVQTFSPFIDSPVIADSIEDMRMAVFSTTGSAEDISSGTLEYLEKVNDASQAARQSKYVEVLRFTPTNTLTSDSIRKSIYRKILLPYYQSDFPDAGYNFTNYQCFNFVSASQLPSGSALVYPEPLNEYMVQTGFAFSFNIKVDRDAGNNLNGDALDYTAGCIMFRSSSYALSVVTGSKKTEKGNPLAWRVLLQLSSAADTSPADVNLNALPANTFISSDNVLRKNHWHNFAVSWGKDHNAGTGSFYIDGDHDEDADFALGTVTINTGTLAPHNAVMIGSRFDGNNSSYSGFFNSAVSSEGVYAGGGGSEPANTAVTNRLNAEVNDIRIHSNVLAPGLIKTGSVLGMSEIPRAMIFYVPCFFVKESPPRLSLLTPFQQETTGTQEPYNVKLSYGVNGRDINLQNFVREFVQETHPRLYYLTASAITKSTQTYDANAFILDRGEKSLMHRAREMFVLPCDNGKFAPAWTLLKSGSSSITPSGSDPMSRFINDYGILNYSVVSLSDMMPTASIFEGLVQVGSDGTDDTSSSGLLQQIMGSSPEDVSVDPGSGYTILQRTRDNSSNAVVFFDASNLFYGKSIQPGTVTLNSNELSGTSGIVSMRLKDNSEGGMYRADASSRHATFSRVGDVLYAEGLFGIMHPCIPFFGKNNFDVDFRGNHNVHVYEVNVPALAGTLNSSSNPRFTPGAKDDYASSYEGAAMTISSIMFHDENFNVVARTNFAQPVLKTEYDKYLFRVKFDF